MQTCQQDEWPAAEGKPLSAHCARKFGHEGCGMGRIGRGQRSCELYFFIGASFDGGGGGYGGRGVRIAVRTRGKLELRVQPEMQVLRGCGHGEGCRCCAMHSVKNRPVPGRSGIVPGTGRVLWESRFKEWGIRKPANGRRTPGKLSALRRCAYLRCACSRCSRWCRC